MFIELPTSLAATAEPGIDLAMDAHLLQTLTLEVPRRGADAGARIRLARPRGARQWPWHAGVIVPPEEPLVFTRGDRSPGAG